MRQDGLGPGRRALDTEGCRHDPWPDSDSHPADRSMAIEIPTAAAMPRARTDRIGRAGLVLAAVALFSPALALPFHHDDFHTLYWARASTFDIQWLFHAWYGGYLGRLIPQLLVMLGMATVGPRHEVYALANLMLHAASVLLVERLARAWTGSRRIAWSAALLFAVGFGFYGKSVIRISNLAMNLTLVLTLWAFLEWHARRRWRAALLWLLTLATHEVAVFAPALAVLAPDPNAPEDPAHVRRLMLLTATGLACATLVLLLRDHSGQAVTVFLGYPVFILVPLNSQLAAELPAGGMALALAPARFFLAHQ